MTYVTHNDKQYTQVVDSASLKMYQADTSAKCKTVVDNDDNDLSSDQIAELCRNFSVIISV